MTDNALCHDAQEGITAFLSKRPPSGRGPDPWPWTDSIASITMPMLGPSRARVAVAGGDDPTVLEAMRIACDCGWVQPVLFGPERGIKTVAASNQIDLDDFEIRDAEGAEIAAAAVAEVRSGGAQALMKGQIATPALLKAMLDPHTGCAPAGSSARWS